MTTPPKTTNELLDLLRKSNLLGNRLEACVEKLRALGQLGADPRTVAAQLVRSEMVTRFQAEELLEGQWRSLFLCRKYKVLELLGGTRCKVCLCDFIPCGRQVAIKMLEPPLAQVPCGLERFYREAHAAAAVDHPNVVHAYDLDQDGGLHFLVMEHVDGINLNRMVSDFGPLNVVRGADYVRQAARGLQHIWERGLVHRKIEPSNILVDYSDTAKIVDFSLARFASDPPEPDDTAEPVGVPHYMAPEQAIDPNSVDVRADIYGLGCVFYFCLARKPPFAEGNKAQALLWHQIRVPPPLQCLRPEVRDNIALVINRMIAKNPADRYQQPQEVADALERLTR